MKTSLTGQTDKENAKTSTEGKKKQLKNYLTEFLLSDFLDFESF